MPYSVASKQNSAAAIVFFHVTPWLRLALVSRGSDGRKTVLINRSQCFFICMSPTLEKLKGHIALGLSVRPFARPCVCNFKIINVLQQTACLVVNPITVGNFAFLFNCTQVGRTSDSMTVPTERLI